MSRRKWNQAAYSDSYEEYYPLYADHYYEDYGYGYEPEYYRYSRRRYLPGGCALLLLILVVILAFVTLMLLTFHPQGFQLIHF